MTTHKIDAIRAAKAYPRARRIMAAVPKLAVLLLLLGMVLAWFALQTGEIGFMVTGLIALPSWAMVAIVAAHVLTVLMDIADTRIQGDP